MMLNQSALARLYEILTDTREFRRILSLLPEPRLETAEWSGVLMLELNALLRWALIRAQDILLNGEKHDDAEGEVLCLLPHYGFSLHAIRRVLPFSILGKRVTVGVRRDKVREASTILSLLAKEVGVSQNLQVSSHSAEDLVRIFDRLRRPIYLTGSQVTYQEIRFTYPSANIVAATGSCSVVVCDDLSCGEMIARKRTNQTRSTSCSNHRATILVDIYDAASPVISVNGYPPSKHTTLFELLLNLHPSIILGPSPSNNLLPVNLCGYTVIPCEDGSPTGVVGFGRDPVGGWAGDYALDLR